MNISWVSERELAHVGDIVRFVNHQEKINIVFKSETESDPVEGRISLKIISEEQETKGVWIYPDTKKKKHAFLKLRRIAKKRVTEQKS